MAGRQQFTVNLDPDLVRRVKHQAVDVQLSLSDLVARVLTTHLDQEASMTAQPTPEVRLQPMVHVENMAEAVAFLRGAGGQGPTR